MKFSVKINDVDTVNQLPGSWTVADKIALLSEFNFDDADQLSEQELDEMIALAVSDFEPSEAAEIVLNYKLSDDLNEGQIKQIAHDMLEDKISEEYPEIGLHNKLFDTNQFLFKAYNGKFPNTEASIIDFKIKPAQPLVGSLTKEHVLKAFAAGLRENSLLKRMFHDHLDGKQAFLEAEDIIWQLKHVGEDEYQMITSDYWLNKEDFGTFEFEGEYHEFKMEEED